MEKSRGIRADCAPRFVAAALSMGQSSGLPAPLLPKHDHPCDEHSDSGDRDDECCQGVDIRAYPQLDLRKDHYRQGAGATVVDLVCMAVYASRLRTKRAGSACFEDCLGLRTRLSTAGGTSDGRFIAPAGAQVVELGPVNATIHKVDECVACDDVEQLTRLYQGILERLLL